MTFFRRVAAAGPSPAVRARLTALFGVPPAAPAAAPAAAPPEPPDGVPLSETEPGSLRIDPGPRGAAALMTLAVVAVAVSGFVVWRGRPRPVDVPPPSVVVSVPPTAAAQLVVDVAGDVRRPGLVRLPAGARVADALTAAGGLRPGATTAGLNLARKLVDGEQVVVGGPAPPAPGGAPGGAHGGAPGSPLNLNAATAEQLDALPGIGPVLADRIVEWRTTHGPFTSVEQLREVSGIGTRTLESLRELVTV